MIDILLVGAGGHAKSCIDVIELGNIYNICGFIDQDINKINFNYNGYSVMGNDEKLSVLRQKYENAFITLGQIKSSRPRISLYNKLKALDYKLPVINSHLSYVSKNSKILEGTIVMHHSIINAGAVIGRNCIINNKALIEHDVIISDNCHVSTGDIVNGDVKVGKGTFIGSGAVIKNNIKIGNNCIIGAGCIIKKNINNNQIVYR